MKRSADNFGSGMLAALATANVLNLIWTIWLTVEQVKTGWGFGTNMELGVLWPWLTQVICVPVLVASIIYFVMCAFQDHTPRTKWINAGLFALVLVQYGIVNLFIWF